MLWSLSNKYSYATLYKGIWSSLMTILEMKMLIINGMYRDIGVLENLEGYSLNAIKRLKRFEETIKNDISVADVIKLLSVLQKYENNYDYESICLGIVNSVGCKYL